MYIRNTTGSFEAVNNIFYPIYLSVYTVTSTLLQRCSNITSERDYFLNDLHTLANCYVQHNGYIIKHPYTTSIAYLISQKRFLIEAYTQCDDHKYCNWYSAMELEPNQFRKYTYNITKVQHQSYCVSQIFCTGIQYKYRCPFALIRGVQLIREVQHSVLLSCFYQPHIVDELAWISMFFTKWDTSYIQIMWSGWFVKL